MSFERYGPEDDDRVDFNEAFFLVNNPSNVYTNQENVITTLRSNVSN